MTTSITSVGAGKRLGWSVKELANALGLSRSLLWEEVRSGRLRGRRVGKRRIVVLDQDLREWLRKAESV